MHTDPLSGRQVRRFPSAGYGRCGSTERSVNRAVASLAEEFEAAERMTLIIPPEGTRRRTDHWKSGFLRIARAADVPIVCASLDYDRRLGCVGPTVWPTADEVADMSVIRSYYIGQRGKYPNNVSDIRLQSEGDGPQGPTGRTRNSVD